NDRADLAVWARAQNAILVNASARVKRRTPVPIARTFGAERSRPKVVLKAMRVQHWVKNLLLFVPLVMAHQIANAHLVVAAIVAFLSFGFCASGIYLINDLLDLEADRRHADKRHRPLASGALSLQG